MDPPEDPPHHPNPGEPPTGVSGQNSNFDTGLPEVVQRPQQCGTTSTPSSPKTSDTTVSDTVTFNLPESEDWAVVQRQRPGSQQRRRLREREQREREKREKEKRQEGNSKRRREETQTSVNQAAKRKDDKVTPSSNKTPATATESAEGEEEQPLIDDEHINRLAACHLSSEGDNENTTETRKESEETYAKKTQKKIFPWILFIHAGENKRLGINKDEFKHILRSLNTFLLTNEEIQEKINIEWSDYVGQTGIIACLDEETHHWVKEFIRQAQFGEGKIYRAWSKEESVRTETVRVFLPDAYEGIPLRVIIDGCLKKNKLEGDYKIVSKSRTKTGLYLKLGFDEKLFSTIQPFKIDQTEKSSTYRMQAGASKLNFIHVPRNEDSPRATTSTTST